jgi:hypothetical protein
MNIVWRWGVAALLLTLGWGTARADALEIKMQPKITQMRDGAFRATVSPALLVGASLSKTSGAFATAPVQDWLQRKYGPSAAPASPSTILPTTPTILIGLERDHPALHKLISDHRAGLPKGGLGLEGYVLDVTPTRILVAATHPEGAYYGALRLAEMDAATGDGVQISAGTVVDWPDMGWRGMHLLVNGRSDLPALETIITRYMPQYRLNQLILEISYHFQYKSHPEVTEGDGLTVEDCHRLKELADRHAVRLIPMINCLGHQSWAAHTAQLLKSHPEFDETPDAPADNKGLYCRSWCPSNPAVSKLVCDLIDEQIDAFSATAFHVGMDEVFILGQCPRCKGTDHAKLFARAVNDLHAHIVGKRKLQILMWADRLLDGKATGYGEWEASENDSYGAVDLIPKDIVLCDWHYETSYNGVPAVYPSVALFQQKGLHVWPSGWRSEENVQLLVAASQRNRTDRMVGYLATTWLDAAAVTGGLEGDASHLQRRGAAGVASAIRKGAQLAWEGNSTAASAQAATAGSGGVGQP